MKMNMKIVAALFLGLLMLSGTSLVFAVDPWPNLPSGIVHLTVVDGTTSYFISTLSNVPGGYGVSDGHYAGWCIERSHNMLRNVEHDVILYSSLDPPDVLKYIDWVAINYILNHKQGEMTDVQEAIWHFVNFVGNYTPTTVSAKEMVNDANLHGAGFVPRTGQVVAVICYPAYGTQITLIEVALDSPLQGQGDINNDGSIDIQDAILLVAAFHTKSGDPNWNRKADLNNDGAIDICDALIMAVNFGRTYP